MRKSFHLQIRYNLKLTTAGKIGKWKISLPRYSKAVVPDHIWEPKLWNFEFIVIF